MSLTPLDLTLAALAAVRSLGLGRTLLLSLVVLPAYLHALPPVGCGCMRPLFRRCDPGVAYLAAARSDLKNLAAQQEVYFAEHGGYTHDPRALAFTPSDGVEVAIFATPHGWSATATHAALGDGRSCAVYWNAAGDRTGPVVRTGSIGEGAPGEARCAASARRR